MPAGRDGDCGEPQMMFLILLHGLQILPDVFRRLLLVALVDLVRIKSEEAQAFSPSVEEAPSRHRRVIVVVVRHRPTS